MKQGYIPANNGEYDPLWRYCKENKIILRTSKKEN